MRIARKGSFWLAATERFVAEVSPQGGKIRSLISTASRRNFFFRDPRRAFHGAAYLQHDISGFDECLPTVGQTRGRFGKDHGLLWDHAWQVRKDGDSLLTEAVHPAGWPVRFTRRLSAPRPQTLRLDYTVVNQGTRPLPYIYSSHPILALDRDSRIHLPGVRRLRVLGHNGALAARKQQPWPVARLADGSRGPLDTRFCASRKLAGKWFAAAPGEACVTWPGERLCLRWDRQALPYLGLWISLGVPLDPAAPAPSQWVCVALEPCTYPHDILKAKGNARLSPGRVFQFWMEWEITRL